MQISVKREALKEFLKKVLSENRSIQSAAIDEIPAKVDDEPIEAKPQMATQLTVEKPPVEDAAYVPASIPELTRAASAISEEVPDTQIKYFYGQLHKILDQALDREDDKKKFGMEISQGVSADMGFDVSIADAVNETLLRIIREQFEDDDEMGPDEVLPFDQRPELPELPREQRSLEDKVFDDAVDYFHSDAFFRRNITDPNVMIIRQGGQEYPFEVGYTKLISQAPEIVDSLLRKLSSPNYDKWKRDSSAVTQNTTQLTTKLIKYVSQFLKDPERVVDADIMIGDVSKIIDTAVKKSEEDPEKFLEIIKQLKNQEKDSEKALYIYMIGLKKYNSLLDPEEEEIEDDEEDFIKPRPEDAASKPETEKDRSALWTRIAELEGFASAAGARQFAFKPMIKMTLLGSVIDERAYQSILTQIGMQFRKQIRDYADKGIIDLRTSQELRRQSGPRVIETGGDAFRYFVSSLVLQPFISSFVNQWKSYAQKVLLDMGVDDPKQTLSKMLVGETSPDKPSAQKKILSTMTMTQFNQARRKSHEFAQDSASVTASLESFTRSRLESLPKVKNSFKSALAEAGII
jgi:hypothetical protein